MSTPQDSARAIALEHDWEVEHQLAVTRIALQLYDQLRPLHEMGAHQRTLLECAGLIHDIGWVGGQKRHHRRSAEMILERGIPGIDTGELPVVAAIARYHRKALPDPKHEIYCDLSAADQQTVRWCGAMLRVADGLDRAHDSAVSGVKVTVGDESISLAVSCTRNCDIDVAGGQRKVSALESESARSVHVERARG